MTSPSSTGDGSRAPKGQPIRLAVRGGQSGPRMGARRSMVTCATTISVSPVARDRERSASSSSTVSGRPASGSGPGSADGSGGPLANGEALATGGSLAGAAEGSAAATPPGNSNAATSAAISRLDPDPVRMRNTRDCLGWPTCPSLSTRSLTRPSRGRRAQSRHRSVQRSRCAHGDGTDSTPGRPARGACGPATTSRARCRPGST